MCRLSALTDSSAVPQAVRPPRLHLDERHQLALPGDDIEIVPTQPEPVRFDVPAAGREVRDGRALARYPAALAAVGPVADGDEAAVGSHGPTIGARPSGVMHRIRAVADEKLRRIRACGFTGHPAGAKLLRPRPRGRDPSLRAGRRAGPSLPRRRRRGHRYRRGLAPGPARRSLRRPARRADRRRSLRSRGPGPTAPWPPARPRRLPDLPTILAPDPRGAVPRLAATLYGHPATRLRLVGITGTLGKTSTALLVQSALAASGVRVGVIGSLGVRHRGSGGGHRDDDAGRALDPPGPA